MPHSLVSVGWSNSVVCGDSLVAAPHRLAHIDLHVCRGDLRHASISTRCPIESDANVAVGLIT